MTTYLDETTRLYLAKNSGNEIDIRNRVVEVNLKLVSHVLKKFKPYSDDQYQIACIGLIKAADTFNIERGVPFSSYACFCIERELHMAHRKIVDTIEEQMKGNMVTLDATTTLSNGDVVDNYDLVPDLTTEKALNAYIEDNALQSICDNVIKTCIKQVASRSNKSTRINIEEWQHLEFIYIMELTFEGSQKTRLNLTKIAASLGVSVQNIRMRHESVMDLIFQRMWNTMQMSFNELLIRLRGGKKIPHRLLVLDPGKTTGWCIFEDGHKTEEGQLADCYDDDNIDAVSLTALLEGANADFILYEDYKVYSHKLDRHAFNPVMTVRLIGVIETFAQLNKIPKHKQMATTAKTFCTDEKLKQWNLWSTGKRHARDAVRHGCYFLLFYKRGDNIV